MKNSKDYAKKIHKLHRSLKKKHPKVSISTYEDPADALVYAIISEHLLDRQAKAAIKRLDDFFVDLNDLRVSREEEIVEMIGEDTPVARKTASTLTTALTCIFDDHHKVSLEALTKIGKRPAKSALEKMEGVSRFVVDYCMLTALGGHAIPLTEQMVEYLHSSELVYPEASEQEIGGFLAKQITAKNGYEFYGLLRRESESYVRKIKTKKKTKTAKKKKVEKTTKSKKSAKKKTKKKTKKKIEKETKTKKKTKKKKTKK